MSKAGLEMLTKSCALEMAAFGVRVNAVAPTICDTNLYRYSGLTDSEFLSMKYRAESSNPLHRVVLPEEVAKAIIFLSSDKSKRVTGHVVKVDGGKALTNSSTIDWYGSDVMNRRYESEAGGVTKFNYFWKNTKESLFKSKSKPSESNDLAPWINEKQVSKWATKSQEAHEKVELDYGEYTIDKDKTQNYEKANAYGGSNNPARAGTRSSHIDRSTFKGYDAF